MWNPHKQTYNDYVTALQRRAMAIREGGHTQRCHTVPTVGDASVGKHSWCMLALLFVLKPDASRELMWACALHDVAERWVGDTPAPAKYGICPELGQALAKAEYAVEEALGIGYDLSAEDEKWLKALDVLEFMLFAADQLALGNRNYELAYENAVKLLQRPGTPQEVVDMTSGFGWQRTRNMVKGEVL